MIRRLAGRFLRAFGLARAARADALAKELRLARRRIAKLEQALAAARESAGRELERHRQVQHEYRRKRDEFFVHMKRLLGNAVQDRKLTDGHLSLVETKLDVLEGAVQALDTRTRSVLMARNEPPPPQGS